MHRRITVLALGLLLAACGTATGAPSASPSAAISGTVNVFAAASLTDAFKALGSAFEHAHPGVTVQFNFAGSPTLVTQIEQGAPADVFASADTTNMTKLQQDGDTIGAPAVFAHNKLAIAVAPGNPKGIHGLADLAQPGLIYISAAAAVPAGRYALQALARAGISVTPRSLETDVKSVVSKIALGEADAGIVYTTDVEAASGKVQGVAIADSDNVVATDALVEVKDAANAAAAAAFIAYVRSPAGQAKLQSFGFLPA